MADLSCSHSPAGPCSACVVGWLVARGEQPLGAADGPVVGSVVGRRWGRGELSLWVPPVRVHQLRFRRFDDRVVVGMMRTHVRHRRQGHATVAVGLLAQLWAGLPVTFPVLTRDGQAWHDSWVSHVAG